MTSADNLSAYRRGRWLLLTLTAVTTGGYAFDSAMDILSGGFKEQQPELISGWLFLGFLCWSLLRGGVTGRAFFILLHSIFFLFFLLGTLCTIITIVSNPQGDFTDTDAWLYSFHNLDNLFLGTMVGVWSAWSLWVLIISKDARSYLRSRRLGVTLAEANAFEWPTARRRQG